jgi:adenylate kinase
LITGTPGVGKTTIAKELASNLNLNYLGISDIIKKEKLYISLDSKRNSLIVDIEEVKKRVNQIIVGSEASFIVEGHFVGDVVPKPLVDMIFVLRKNPHELKIILENRGYSEKKVYENLEAEILDVCLWDMVNIFSKDRICEINTTGLKLEKIVEKIILAINKLESCEIGIVDWLNTLVLEGNLKKFFRFSEY